MQSIKFGCHFSRQFYCHTNDTSKEEITSIINMRNKTWNKQNIFTFK